MRPAEIFPTSRLSQNRRLTLSYTVTHTVLYIVFKHCLFILSLYIVFFIHCLYTFSLYIVLIHLYFYTLSHTLSCTIVHCLIHCHRLFYTPQNRIQLLHNLKFSLFLQEPASMHCSRNTLTSASLIKGNPRILLS